MLEIQDNRLKFAVIHLYLLYASLVLLILLGIYGSSKLVLDIHNLNNFYALMIIIYLFTVGVFYKVKYD